MILAATSPGMWMVPPDPLTLWELYSAAGTAPSDAGLESPSSPGVIAQGLAACGWSSLTWLSRLGQRTLILAGQHDRLVPPANARLLAELIPNAELSLIDAGHLFLRSRAQEAALLARRFLLD